MLILAIDPGTLDSAYVLYDSERKQILDKNKVPNHNMRRILKGYNLKGSTWHADAVAIEMIASYGMPVGKEVFETCVWIGRLCEIIEGRCPTDLVYRKDVKLHLCGSPKANDGNIRQALIDLFPPIGGGTVPQVGTKKDPGPLHGVSKDIWAALGVAVTYAARREK